MRLRTQAPRNLVQAGFTLIELVIVIVILGILAAIAIPKFQDLSNSAEIAAAKTTAAELSAGASIAYAATKAGVASATYSSTCTGMATYVAGGTIDTTKYTLGGTAPNCTLTYSGTAYSFTVPQ